jgi:hypothetical protein
MPATMRRASVHHTCVSSCQGGKRRGHIDRSNRVAPSPLVPDLHVCHQRPVNGFCKLRPGGSVMAPAAQPSLMVIIAASSFGIAGCTIAYPAKFFGNVTRGKDGQVLSGVTGTFIPRRKFAKGRPRATTQDFSGHLPLRRSLRGKMPAPGQFPWALLRRGRFSTRCKPR